LAATFAPAPTALASLADAVRAGRGGLGARDVLGGRGGGRTADLGTSSISSSPSSSPGSDTSAAPPRAGPRWGSSAMRTSPRDGCHRSTGYSNRGPDRLRSVSRARWVHPTRLWG